jgi:hypothetical protein
MADFTDLVPPVRTDNWAERNGAWVLSLCVHVLVLFFLYFGSRGVATSPKISEPRKVRIRIVPTQSLVPNAPPKKPERVLPARSLPSSSKGFDPSKKIVPPTSEVQPASKASSAEKTNSRAAEPPKGPGKSLDPVPGKAAPSRPAKAKTEPAKRTAIPRPNVEAISIPSKEEKRVADVLEAYKQRKREERAAAREGADGEGSGSGGGGQGVGMKDIRHRINNIAIGVAAAPNFPGYKGARVGVVRTLDLSNPDKKIAQRLMMHYDIRVNTRYVDQIGPSYLNSAASGGSVYSPVDKPGYYEVFEISPRAFERMVWLENQWLVSHGCNPDKTLVDSVAFGIVRSESAKDGWDIGIVDIKYRRVDDLSARSLAPAPIEKEE